jgi:hypothetical protein
VLQIAVVDLPVEFFPMIGATISHYRFTETLGQGGMGVVYRAEDTSLNRQVAIKVLPDIFAGDPEQLAGFERAAKWLASLNHCNIAAIHGLEEAGGKRFLVLEPVEGETPAQGNQLRMEAIDRFAARRQTEGGFRQPERGQRYRGPAHFELGRDSLSSAATPDAGNLN